jgi:2-dehydro-3-deoxyphosphogluconate aldolase/(4S)-4-hydroxy-2-oxoglutarate aldolase
MSPPDPLPLFAQAPVIPVLTIEDAEQAVPLARALCEGGLPAIEVTLRTAVALEAIRAISSKVPDAIVGAGTLRNEDDIAAAIRAGARFLVTPGTTSAMGEALAGAGVPVLPGCASVSEALALAEIGFRAMKFFPAEASGGVAFLKAVFAPLPDLRFCPTGGIDMSNAADYLALPNVFAVGGSWVAPREALAGGDYARIAALARNAANLRANRPGA